VTVEKRSAHRDELEQDIVVSDIGGQRYQAEPLRLKEQHTVLERAQFAVLPVSLDAAEDSR
jgi:hypothetical protein